MDPPHKVPASPGDFVFVSYSHEDEKWRRKFRVVLDPLVRERRLEVWADDHIQVGDEWRREIDDALRRATLGLLLVTAEFLASRFVMEEELPRLIERRVRLICALVGDCLWEEVPALERVQWAHDPRRDGPLARRRDPRAQIVDICRRISGLLPGDGAGRSDQSHIGLLPDGAPELKPTRTGRPGRMDGVPPLPPGYVESDRLAALRSALTGVEHRAVGLTGARALGLHGQGGIGKTVTAIALARDNEFARHFSDGIYWVGLGEHTDLVAAQIDLLRRLGLPQAQPRAVSEGLALLREQLAERRCLLVVDDVWSRAAAGAFRVTGPHGRVLYTTRDPAVLQAVGAREERVDILSVEAARALLAGLAGTSVADLPAEAERVLDATGRVALGLALVGAAVGRGDVSWAEAIEALDEGRETFLDHPYANAFRSIQTGVGALDDAHRRAYLSLAVFPANTQVPVGAIARFWAHLAGASTEVVREQLEELAARELLTLAGDGVSLHNLQRDFLLLEAYDLSVLHADLLAAYRALLPADSSAWRDLPRDEPYIWDQLFYHLRATGDRSAIAATATDLAYLAVRILLGGRHAAEADLRLAVTVLPDRPAIAWLSRGLAQWGHVFTALDGLGDIAVTLASRTRDAPQPVDADALAALLPPVYLEPRWGLLSAPALTRVLDSHGGAVLALAFSPDQGSLASAGNDPTVRVWDPASGRLIVTLEGHTGSVTELAFSPDGRRLASAGDDGTVRLWDAVSGRPAATLKGHTNAVRAVAFSPDGDRLLSADLDRTVRTWDLVGGQPTATLGASGRPIWAIALSSDARLLAIADIDATVWLSTLAGDRPPLRLEGHTGTVHGLAFSPDGRRFASAGTDGTVRLWDTTRGRLTVSLEGHFDGIWAVAFSGDGKSLASAGVDQTVRLWDAVDGQPTATLQGHADTIFALAFSPDGRTLASGGMDRTTRLWDLAESEPVAASRKGRGRPVRAVAFSPDGSRLASAGDDHLARLWDPARGRGLDALGAGPGAGSAVALSPDGSRLASGGDNGAVHLWEMPGGRRAAISEGHDEIVRAVAFSPDGRWLASAGPARSVRLSDPITGRHLATLRGHFVPVQAVTFSPDGHLLASASGDRTVRLWDPTSGRPVAILEGHTDFVWAVAFSPDGRQLASGADDKTLRLWDVAARRSTAALTAHTKGVRAAAFSPDGRWLASAGDDGLVCLWNPHNSALVSKLALGEPTPSLAWAPGGLAAASGRAVVLLAVRDRTRGVWAGA